MSAHDAWLHAPVTERSGARLPERDDVACEEYGAEMEL